MRSISSYSSKEVLKTDLIVVGAGAAGLFTALTAAQEGAAVVLISPTPLAGAASYWAQGGLAAALATEDSPELHFADTVAAGRGTVRPSAAQKLCEQAPDCVRQLQSYGVSFDADRQGNLALALEGGHSARRITHAGGSATGRRVIRQLSAVAAQSNQIRILEGLSVTALLTDSSGHCSGVKLSDQNNVFGRATVLATGGAAALWSRTTNPPGSRGTGLLLAHSTGAELADLEMVQFHPTALRLAGKLDGFLITEAARGEGAKLLNCDLERFTDELAARDLVARAIEQSIRSSSSDHLWLDMREIDLNRFPNIIEALATVGIDPLRELVPVAPAAHYMMGGIVTDNHGQTSVEGLFAVGECSCTGLHGANRLASNSLSECFVYGRSAALKGIELEAKDTADQTHSPETEQQPVDNVGELLWDYVGLRREAAGLTALTESSNTLVRLIATSALARNESRGAHVRKDINATDPKLDLYHTVIDKRDKKPRFERWI